jgi:PKD domain/Secretion system C-terminal sorting domain
MKHLKYTLMLAVVALLALPTYGQLYIQHNVNQAPALVANAGLSASFCAGDSITLGGNPSAIGGTAPLTYAWSPSTDLNSASVSNPITTPSVSTVYQLLVTDARNCSSTALDSLALVVPAAAFTSTSNLLAVSFADLSLSASTWAWSFGDGGTSSLQNPTHTYANGGTYLVCLTINAGTGCEQVQCDSITVVPVGVANAMPGMSVQVYPNPSSGSQVNFAIHGASLSGLVVIEFMDLQGRSVLRYEGNASQAIHTVNRKQLAAGAYQYRVTNDEVMIGAGKVVFR